MKHSIFNIFPLPLWIFICFITSKLLRNLHLPHNGPKTQSEIWEKYYLSVWSHTQKTMQKQKWKTKTLDPDRPMRGVKARSLNAYNCKQCLFGEVLSPSVLVAIIPGKRKLKLNCLLKFSPGLLIELFLTLPHICFHRLFDDNIHP